MSLTSEQAAAVEKILAAHREELEAILQRHKQEVQAAVERIDRQKSEELKHTISSL